jgi:hypothetical protein
MTWSVGDDNRGIADDRLTANLHPNSVGRR